MERVRKAVGYMDARVRNLSKEAGVYLLFLFAGSASVLALPWVRVRDLDGSAALGFSEVDVRAEFAVSWPIPFDLMLIGLMAFVLAGILADGRWSTRTSHAGFTAVVAGVAAIVTGSLVVRYIWDALADRSHGGLIEEPGVGLFLAFVCSLAAAASALRCCLGNPSGMSVWDAEELDPTQKKGAPNEVQEVQ